MVQSYVDAEWLLNKGGVLRYYTLCSLLLYVDPGTIYACAPLKAHIYPLVTG